MAQALELVLVDEAGAAPVADAAVKAESRGFASSLTSDARGSALISMPDDLPHLAVHVRCPGYVPRLLVWDRRRAGLKLPEQFTLPMERARTIGGFVRDAEGRPVEGAKVLVSLRGALGDSRAPRIESDIWEQPALTDAQGRWQFHEAPEDVKFIRVLLDHPDFVSLEHIYDPPAPKEFAAGTAVLTLVRGTPCEGVVTDNEGRPLSDVRVVFGERGSGSPSKPMRQTDAEGKFRFGGLSLEGRGMEKPILSFLKEGYAPELLELDPTTMPIEPRVVLRPGKALRLKFTDAAGTPIPRVMIAIHGWRGHRPFSLAFEADERGFLEWKDAPSDGVTFAIMHDSIQREDRVLTATYETQTIVLARPMVITGRVIDARTKQPLPVFRVVRGRYFPEHPRTWSDWRHDSPQPFTQGEYRCTLGEPVRMHNADHSPGEIGAHRLRVEADGYIPAISRPIANEEQDVRIDFELEPGAVVAGTVRDEQGHALPGVMIIVAGHGNPVFVMNGKVRQRGYVAVTTDAQGRYELPPQEEDFPVLLIKPDVGYLVANCRALAESPDVKLLRWGRLELATTAGQDSKPRHFLRPADEQAHREARIRFESQPVFLEGAWVFEHLCAGPMRLGTYGAPMEEGPIVMIESGKTITLDFRSGRRNVIGRIALPPEGLPTSRQLAHLRVRPRLPESAMPPGFDEEKRQRWLAMWGTAPEGANPQPEIRERPFEIDAAGRFRIDGLNFGHYRLIGIFHRSRVKPGDTEGDLAGLLKHDFELVSGEDDLDLGTLALQPGGRFKVKTVISPPKPPS